MGYNLVIHSPMAVASGQQYNIVENPAVKVAVNTIVPRSPHFAFCTPKYMLLQK